MDMIMALWTWRGQYFGYRLGDFLWTKKGEYVGRFFGNDVYASDGRYLGEVIQSRLYRRESKCGQSKNLTAPYKARVDYEKVVAGWV